MRFIVLAKMKKEITKESEEATDKFMQNPPPGIKIHEVFYTLGRYDLVIFYEAPSEKEAMATSLAWADKAATETLIAVPREEAIKLLR
jgi:uncharacterized protein with GYD domain